MKSMMLTALALTGSLVASAERAKAEPAKREIILHVEASAEIQPDQAVVPIDLMGAGRTEAEASADLEQAAGRTIARLEGMGIERSSFRASAGQEQARFQTVPGDCAAGAAADAAGVERREKQSASHPVQNSCEPATVYARRTYAITVNEPVKMEALLSSNRNSDLTFSYREVQYGHRDPEAARKAARVEAIAKARTEAGALATELGYRIVRIDRVSNAKPAISFAGLAEFISAMDRPGSRAAALLLGGIIETVSIDFVVVPH